MIKLSSTGEIADFRDVDQFQPAKTEYACGFFSGAIVMSMAPVGSPPTQSVSTMIAEALTWYAQDDGSNAASNSDGMSLQAEYDLITGKMGLHYQAVALDADTIRAWVDAGYPIMLTIAETSVFDMALNSNPYPWNPVGSHIIVVSGVASDGNLLVRDPANCTDLYDPNSLRPGPRKYDANKLTIYTATVVVPAWMPRPTSAIAPTNTGEDMIDITNPWVAEYFKQTATNPTRWDCAHTGQSLFAGILAGWCAMNGAPRLPTGPETPCGKQAVYQECESGIVLYDPAHEIDAPNGPWEPCYLLKLDSALAKKLLGTSITIPVDIPAIVAALKTLQAYNDTAIVAALKTLGAS